jgi:hypothetical protein
LSSASGCELDAVQASDYQRSKIDKGKLKILGEVERAQVADLGIAHHHRSN